MNNLISFILLLGMFLSCAFKLHSQNIKYVGKYQLRHNIPKEAFISNGSTNEFPTWVHDEIIEIKRNKKVYITIINGDESDQKNEGTWDIKDGQIEIKSEIGNFTFRLVIIEDKPHLNSIDNKFKYYIKI